ncbi:hypothetical protein DL96DRAFT_1736175 [Flagelloscypha sp. PMI_526]|nr:hypothetical protein DL96DRAFT_1736175 [Flagelloscypha sp. PMI_526]
MGAFNLAVGSFLLGLSFECYLTYKNTKFDDRIWLRAIVATLFVVDTSQVAVELYTVWYFLVENYINPSALNHLFWMLGVFGVGTALSASIVQTFLINRWALSTYKTVLALYRPHLRYNSGISVRCNCRVLSCATKPIPVIPLEIAWLATVAAVDIVITVTLRRALWRSKTGFPATDTNINRCIRASIQSGLFSSVFALAGLAAFIFWGNTHVNMIFGWPSGRIYSNSLLYTLVARKEHAEITNRTVEIQRTGLFSPPVPPQISSIHFPQEILTDANVADNTVKPSLDRHIAFSPPTGTVCGQK